MDSSIKIIPLTDEDIGESPGLKGLDKIAFGISWVGPVIYCPFCGRPTSNSAVYYDIKVRK